jgi:Fe-S cluster biosynthesis and repair protein YggX
MARMIQCIKLQREAEGLDRQPLPGELGKRLFDSVSKEAWLSWREHSKMLVNEYRLDLTRKEHQKVWDAECEKFFFGEGPKLPEQFKPAEEKAPDAKGADDEAGAPAGAEAPAKS